MRWLIIGYTMSAVYVVFANLDAQGRYSQLLAWLVGRVNKSADAKPCLDGWRWSMYGDVDYFHEGQRAVGPWEFTTICTTTLQRVEWARQVAASFGTPFYLGICAFFLSTMHNSYVLTPRKFPKLLSTMLALIPGPVIVKNLLYLHLAGSTSGARQSHF